MVLAPDTEKDTTKATVVLHNMLRIMSQDSYTPEGSLDNENSSGIVQLGDWRDDKISFTNSLPKTRSNRTSKSVEEIRNTLGDHFYGLDQIPWQWKILF